MPVPVRLDRSYRRSCIGDAGDFLQGAIDALSAHIAVLDAGGRIALVNQAWRSFAVANGLSWRQAGLGADYLGVCDAAVGDETAAAAGRGLRRVLASAGELVLEYPCHAPQEERWFRLRATRFDHAGQPWVVVAHENITVERAVEKRLRERNAALARSETRLERLLSQSRRRAGQLQSLARASLAIAAAPDLAITLRSITLQARRAIGARMAVTSMINGASGTHLITSVSLGRRYARWRSYQATPTNQGIYSLVCENNQPIRLTQAELLAHPRWRGFGQEAGRHPPLRGWLAVPLIGRDGRNLGLIQLSDKREGEFTAEDEAILIQLAQFGVTAIQRAEAEAGLRASEARLRDAVESMPDGFALWDKEDRSVLVNRRRLDLLSPQLASEARPGETFAETLQRMAMSGLVPDAVGREEAWIAEEIARHRNPAADPHEHHLADGRWVRIVEHQTSEGGTVGIYSDITAFKTREQEIRRLAERDALTDLPNRRVFQDRLAQALAACRRHGRQGALMLLDLDRFKDINDALGHGAGDALLREVAQRLCGCLRGVDTVARLGGDEFAIIVDDVGGPGDAALVAGKVTAALEQPVRLEGHEIYTATSAGITLFPVDGDDPVELMRNADIALYQAKEAGRGTWRFFDDAMRREVDGRKRLETALRGALERAEFTVHYQPVLDIASGRFAGFEALLRWQRNEAGTVSPAEFLRVAEDSGLIRPIGAFVLKTALAQMRAWLAAGLEPGRVAINLAAAQFVQDDLGALVEAELGASGLGAERLTIEVTENVFLGRESDLVGETLHRLHRRGVTIALDDFGTGYASLSHLKRYPVDLLKIDRSFVRDVLRDPEDTAIVRALVALGRSLGLKLIAEGVETAAQLDFLRAEGCDCAQGYLISPPLAAEEATGLLRGRAMVLPPLRCSDPVARLVRV